MKKTIIILFVILTSHLLFAQETPKEQTKDSIKTEVVEVVTSFAPKISDAFKIKKKPVIKLSSNAEKKSLSYSIKSVPVASTFIPQSGTIKKIKVEERERIYKNYITVGFGNNTSVLVEGYLYNNTPFDSEYEIDINFTMSNNPIKSAVLNSGFYNAHLQGFYKQEDRNFDWSTGFNIYRNTYNWYGLPTNIEFLESTINQINEEQIYHDYNLFGNIEFLEGSYVSDAKLAIGFYADNFQSSEITTDVNTLFLFPLDQIATDLNELNVGFSINFLNGKFNRAYNNTNAKKYGFLSAGLNPYYQFNWSDFDIKLGAKGYFSMNFNSSENNFLIYPDVTISYPIAKSSNIYAGASGDLNINSFKKFTNENPYISPTITLLRGNEMYSFFTGLKGVINSNINYNFKGNYAKEQNKALYRLHRSKSDGTTISSTNGFTYKGYEYGNSFDVLYDDITTISVNGELEYDPNKNISVGLSATYNQYSLTKEAEAWNLPQLTATVFGKYRAKKWDAGVNLYYVGNRKGIMYQNTTQTSINLSGYIDVNINGSYHFNPFLSAFVKVNNASNGTYQRFNGFDSQGVQAIGGIIWKFDSLF